MESENSAEVTFRQKLTLMHSTDKKSVLMTKDEYFMLIEELKAASNESATKTNRQYYISKRYVILIIKHKYLY